MISSNINIQILNLLQPIKQLAFKFSGSETQGSS